MFRNRRRRKENLFIRFSKMLRNLIASLSGNYNHDSYSYNPPPDRIAQMEPKTVFGVPPSGNQSNCENYQDYRNRNRQPQNLRVNDAPPPRDHLDINPVQEHGRANRNENARPNGRQDFDIRDEREDNVGQANAENRAQNVIRYQNIAPPPQPLDI